MVEDFNLIAYSLVKLYLFKVAKPDVCIRQLSLIQSHILIVWVADRQIISMYLCSHCTSMPLQYICSYHAIAIFMYVSVIHVLWLITYGYIAST